MASSGAYSSHYTRLLRNGYVIAEITSIGDISVTRDDIEVTHYDSDDGYKEFIAGLADGGELTIEGNFIVGDTNGQLGLKTDYEAGTIQSFELAFPNDINSSWEIQASVTSFGSSHPIGDKIGFAATMKVTGKPVLILNTGSTGLTTPFFTLSGELSGAITPSPTASGSIYLYSATAGASDTYVTVTPTATAGTIKVNGVTKVSGVGENVTIPAATTTPVFISVKETDKAPKIYKINITRP
jgi:predicted secreted protein